jgi:hypothetical protein
MSALSVSWQRIYNTGTITVSLNYTLQILHIKYSLHSRTLATSSSRPPVQNWTLNCAILVPRSSLFQFSLILVRVRVRVTLRLAVYRQSVRLGAKPLETHSQIFVFQLNTCGHNPYVTSSDERMGLSFTIAAGPRQSIHSQVRVPQDSWPHFTVSDSRLPQPAQVLVFISPKNRVAQLYPRHWVPFPPPITIRRATEEVIRTLLHTLEGQSAMPWCINSRRTEYKT